MHRSIELVPAEVLQYDGVETGDIYTLQEIVTEPLAFGVRTSGSHCQEPEPGISWFWRAYEVAETQLNRPVMCLLTAVFALMIILFYAAFAALLCWQPHA